MKLPHTLTTRSVVMALLVLLVALGSRSPASLLAQSTPTGKTPTGTPTDTIANTPANAARPGAAAPLIAVTDVARDLAAFAADSLRARETPSAGLTAAAAYMAGEFRRLGLHTEVQTYPIPGQQRVDTAASKLQFLISLARHGKPVVAEDGGESLTYMTPFFFQTDVYFAPEVGPQTIKTKRRSTFSTLPDPLLLLAGPHTPASVRQVAETLRSRVVLYVPPVAVDTVLQRQVIAALYAVAQGVVVVGPSDSARFAAARARAPEATFADAYLRKSQDWNPWAVVVNSARVGGMLAPLGEDLERLRASDTPVLRALALYPYLRVKGKAATDDVVRAPNVIATLPGSDATVRDDSVVIVAPLDTRRRGDVSSATAGLLALARAFTQPGQQPRRSIVFLAASGGTHEEFWGANYFVNEGWQSDRRKLVALVLDRLGQWPGDSVPVRGLRDIETVPSLSWAVGTHPEIDLRIVDGGTVAQPFADQFAFVRATIPSLYVYPAGEARPTDAEAEPVVRGTRLVFALAQALANAAQRPHWSIEGRQQLRLVLEPSVR